MTRKYAKKNAPCDPTTDYAQMAAPLVPTQPISMQDVINFLKDNMRIDVSADREPYEQDYRRIQVEVRLGDEVIASGYDTYRI